ncbi:DASH family cryptochrome [Methylophaga sp. OBS3]|uniref:DASH family cryptochrome n=1 Tax=Methylophaga sp. OBS3 TaxID=2991934 RepID=UPI002250FE80|nr:DASH family cryptochrome [Methylophaga sp. OBS3]MCX4189039.1 DASH family cryptochrome [Methylophaga sp. OBS3]
MSKTGLFWFQNDLRLHDHPALWQMQQCDRLICVFCFDPNWYRPNSFNAKAMGKIRDTFLKQAVVDLSAQLKTAGQQLLVIESRPDEVIAELIARYQVSIVGQSKHPGVYENRYWQRLKQQFPDTHFYQVDSATLFDESNLPFLLPELPKTFSQFRKLVEKLPVNRPLATITHLPASPDDFSSIDNFTLDDINSHFPGGEQAALAQVKNYFDSAAPASYKETRNELDGWQNSSKFSPWLAQGSLSVRTLFARLKSYEQEKVANESTYWLYFELLWREYFQWYAHQHKNKLFDLHGITGKTGRACYYPERYQRWCHGNTPYPLVNALMNELNETGYMSNRGRQIVASCFIHELKLDWRFGAAYFEQQLIDYDVASNWGNWQYIAGVGADPRGGRHFNIQKQTDQYDPNGHFISKWRGDNGNTVLDSVDAADWPIMPPGR